MSTLLTVEELAALVIGFSRAVDCHDDQEALQQLQNIAQTERARRDAYIGFFETAYERLLSQEELKTPKELADRAAVYAECALIVWDDILRDSLARSAAQMDLFEQKMQMAKRGPGGGLSS